MSEKAKLKISAVTARRYILGLQGLWPGRRWQGIDGTEHAIRASEHLQLDPLNVVARSQDLTLHSRVIDYRPEYLNRLAYEERKFFDWGTWLAFRPMEELPHWRNLMKRHEKNRDLYEPNISQKVYAHVLAELALRGPLGNRDFEMLKRVESYRGRKETAVALFRLWLSGKVMTHHRERFERIYDLSENIIPAKVKRSLRTPVSDLASDLFLLDKSVAFHGIARLGPLQGILGRKISRDEEEKLRRKFFGKNLVEEISIEGWKGAPHYVLKRQLPHLERLHEGKIPDEWEPLETTTEEEVSFLAPLDIVSARGRAKQIFDFDYIWEVYKPESLRKWGYYTLPILWGDQLVARLDPKLDRKSKTLEILGFWPEKKELVKDPAFLTALSAGIRRFAVFVGAESVQARCVPRGRLRSAFTGKA